MKTAKDEVLLFDVNNKLYYIFFISVVLSFNYCVLSTLLEHSCKHIL